MTLALSRGNRGVFATVAPAVCDFVDASAGGACSGPPIDEFVAELPSTLAPDAGTELPPCLEFGHAYRHYHEALEASSDKVRSEAILAGDIVLAYNAQLRLQPVIEAAFTALPQHLRMLLRTNRCFVARLPFVRVVGQFWLDAIEYSWTRYATERLVSLTIAGDEVVRPGSDVPPLPDAPPGVSHRYPDVLRSLDDPRLAELWRHCSRARDDGSGSGVSSWIPLAERLSWIVNWMRSRQQYRRVFERPFTDEELARLEAGDAEGIGPGGSRASAPRPVNSPGA